MHACKGMASVSVVALFLMTGHSHSLSDGAFDFKGQCKSITIGTCADQDYVDGVGGYN